MTNSMTMRGSGTKPVAAGRLRMTSRHKTENEAFSKRDFITLYIDEHRQAKSPKPGLTPPPTQGLH